jgi:hypothetical protein
MLLQLGRPSQKHSEETDASASWNEIVDDTE